jgi:hypothetical protein
MAFSVLPQVALSATMRQTSPRKLHLPQRGAPRRLRLSEDPPAGRRGAYDNFHGIGRLGDLEELPSGEEGVPA